MENKKNDVYSKYTKDEITKAFDIIIDLTSHRQVDTKALKSEYDIKINNNVTNMELINKIEKIMKLQGKEKERFVKTSLYKAHAQVLTSLQNKIDKIRDKIRKTDDNKMGTFIDKASSISVELSILSPYLDTLKRDKQMVEFKYQSDARQEQLKKESN